ncbi:hypothetical protein WME99_44605 [Sorangium sp. So ce136]|uniref:hypothetical protein n=1 Tax=Sorangium sp. So ce136 TaxID=3133284 RepID=UPI003F00CA23
MAEAYAAAAVRHWSDAEFCKDAQRLPNADQLYGFAAECALKVALLKVPGCVGSGELQKRYREHVDALWELIPLQSVERFAAQLVPLLRSTTKPFADWSIDQRYASGEAITIDILNKHREAARRVIGAVGLLGERRGS